jgi:hypothetical protein
MKKMTNYLYNVNAKYENAEIEIRTNDVNLAIEEFFARVEDDVPTDIISGITGEVLVSANNGENNCLGPGWDLMLLGWLMQNQWGEGITVEKEESDIPPLVRDALIDFAKSIAE